MPTNDMEVMGVLRVSVGFWHEVSIYFRHSIRWCGPGLGWYGQCSDVGNRPSSIQKYIDDNSWVPSALVMSANVVMRKYIRHLLSRMMSWSVLSIGCPIWSDPWWLDHFRVDISHRLIVVYIVVCLIPIETGAAWWSIFLVLSLVVSCVESWRSIVKSLPSFAPKEM